ncbi:hypothetical protein DL89DRAFT_294006 [Linderina pennispora]|uniref:Uncharacterized protein n=1 Tax=Linderina pennispora TaxID=61395 RepID=A0A1Y1W6E0_9FUNG|nr:uncharacterized protein DL89DRAFT_294006 [Linderina pennispora]ORX68816.1 hypothetical protein DL89DRAFT_294006 [Linderina pennispora]
MKFFTTLTFFALVGLATAVSDSDYAAIKKALASEMSNHHTFTTPELYHDLAAALGLTDACAVLYNGSPNLLLGYQKVYERLSALANDPTNTAEQTKTIGDLRDFTHNVVLTDPNHL